MEAASGNGREGLAVVTGAEVARQGYEALMAGEERVVGASFESKAQVAAGKLLPDSKKAEMHRSMAEPGSAEEDRA